MSTKTQKIKDAVYTAPYLIPGYLKNKTFDHRITTGILAKLLPLRWGIEFECINGLPININNSLNLYDFSQNYPYNPESDQQNEIRLSGQGYLYLSALYMALNKMKTYCKLIDGGGIHIHINYLNYPTNQSKLVTFFSQSKILDQVYKIFGSKYVGNYNLKNCSIHKGNWVRITHNTIEFRIGDLTFEYEEIVQILIKLQSLVKRALNETYDRNEITDYYEKESKKYKYPVRIS